MEQVEVAIVGGGLSGLAAARRLRAAGVSRVAVLEGAARPGGRATVMADAPLKGYAPGSMWLRRADRELIRLAEELGVPVRDTALDRSYDDLCMDDDGDTRVSRDNIPLDVTWWTRLRKDLLISRVVRMAEKMDFVCPWRHPKAEELDQRSVHAWLREHSSDRELLTLLEENLTVEACTPAERISMLWLLAHIGPTPVPDAHPLRLDPVLLAGRLAAEVGADPGISVRTGHHVAAVDTSGERIRASGDWGGIEADQVVMAVSPADAYRVAFHPEQAPSRRRFQREWPQAEIIRTEVIYERPFWREAGLSGDAYFDEGIPAYTIDDSPPGDGFGRLIAHTYTFGAASPLGADQRIAESPERHREVLLRNLEGAFGDEAAEPVALAQSVASPGTYSRAYQSPMPPGFLTEYGPLLREPSGAVHWAAAETSGFPENSTLEGALTSARRAADEVLRRRQSVSSGAPQRAQ
ncbi:flavin monoamine oxidase family protein [Nocardiopsis potens]|uniref:flavin monoamine oxidase family protein n=1 Tax=Nocardiopsis potens TaxID=1246458 RepID=UPI00034A1A00|nr:FAD-dependent oxidoreductase [Nocardiopsis potens]